MAHNTLITGGARSGKSRFAEELTLGFGGLACYLATAQALDDEMEERIHRHQFRRGNSWETIEEPLMIPQTLARIDGIYSVILLDCVTLWLSNLLLSCDENDPGCEEQIASHVHRLATTLRGMSTPVVLVTNEVGQGIVPEHRLGRLYRDIAGQANQILAACCDHVHVCISGIPLKLK
ncbi:MAG: bifunctional adenosylcobinamide kinase/adenosylcobinamide-phosphate guanylyltransferase [Trichlorobacter sp.]|uniref:bifunctional adenosylcobinamide kinase/adenosylcobinamide-phosphate guanylyltransferase n=1 Tax=Trichlorobacter sp. TaxID=2911007 RepID=UPI00255E3351|nr:bifunctional adenosylcobinamide kinase/adenosylcobinamide-phosphate guanylyltransferase [Trichlorobacter sp.]MDK9716998.1 bifunctional adenosylcobinamide kinase/adenosylcobinamide-phosphate guanylyltransferase [Trichlorobacter sp.]